MESRFHPRPEIKLPKAETEKANMRERLFLFVLLLVLFRIFRYALSNFITRRMRELQKQSESLR